MGTTGAIIAQAAAMGPRYASRLIEEIPAERFGRFASPGGQVVEANHPAFILGHLCLYPQQVLDFLGQDPAPIKPPENYTELFSKKAKCQDDADGSLYPHKEELVAFFMNAHEAALDTIREATEEQLLSGNPVDTPLRKVAPTLGGLLTFYLTSHVMTHLGQLSTWRRMEQMPPV